jgi:signal transduction histidine kinase
MRARERFISNVSHELRTPLQQILVFAELLRMDKLRSDDERRHSMNVIERETRRLIQLVENVLAFARTNRDGMTLSREPVRLEPLIRETVTAFEPLALASRAALRVVADSQATAAGDPDAIRRALLNLLDNAVKYGPAGQTVTVSISERAGSAVIAIEDEGPGVPAADRERIWSAFSRLDREEEAAIAGSGIGLSIVRELVERMDGSVHVEDAENGGARFVISLPSALRE